MTSEASNRNPPKFTVIVIMGVAGSGKSTVGRLLADRLGWQFADADDFHAPANIEKMRSGQPLTDNDRRPWLEALQATIKNWISENKRGALACSALKDSYRAMLAIDERVGFVFLSGSFELFSQRLALRQNHYMKAHMLQSQMDALEEPANALNLDASLAPNQIVEEILTKMNLG